MSAETGLMPVLVILILTYFVLIWRINRLIIVLESTKGVFRDIHAYFAKLKDNSSGLVQAIDQIVKGELKLESEKHGSVTIKLGGKKK